MQSSHYDSGSSYVNLRERVLNNLRDQNISKDILVLLENAFGKTLSEKKIVLSKAERRRLFRQVSKELLTELLEQHNKS